LTTIVPCMLAWIPQTYAYVPAVANVRVYVEPVASGALEAVPSSHFTLCDGPSWLVHVTVAPAFTVRLAGAKAKFWIVTASPAAAAGWLAAELAAALAAGLAAATLAAGLAGAGVGLAALPQAASARLAEIARPVMNARRMGLPSGLVADGGRRSVPRRLAPILRPDTPAGPLPVLPALS
jgi:hypothetical protein